MNEYWYSFDYNDPYNEKFELSEEDFLFTPEEEALFSNPLEENSK